MSDLLIQVISDWFRKRSPSQFVCTDQEVHASNETTAPQELSPLTADNYQE
jgi:hypothetical protein